MKLKLLSNRLLITGLLTAIVSLASSQNLLNKNITIEANSQRLDNVLEILSNRGNFYFSYNSNIIKKDSIITLASSSKPVKQWLEILLPDNYEFRESGNYIIIRKAPVKLTIVTNKAATDNKYYVVSGYVLDDLTGYWIHNASIYEASLLASTLTNVNGFFSLRFRQKKKRIFLTVSKDFYKDTSFAVDAGYNQQVTITMLPASSGTYTIIGPDDYFAPEQFKIRVQQADSGIREYTYSKTDSAKVEKTQIGAWLATPEQKIQGINLKKFFTTRAFQFSLTPGLGTHGQLSAQVVNNFSLNVLGGYNGGVNGLEIGGLFNIDKKSVRYVQVGGLFNIVGGYVQGFQAAGINNTVLDTVKGFQVAGVNNLVKGKLVGFQAAGVYNHVTDKVDGVQVAGVGNFAKTSDGYSIGLINIVFKGYHKLSFYSDELVNANAAFKTGSRRLYNILQAGMNFSDSNEVFTFGYGIGTELPIGKIFSVNPEFTAQHLYLGSWEYANVLAKGKLNINIKLGKYVSLFGGPVFNAYHTYQDEKFPGYRTTVPPSGWKTWKLGPNVKGWLGWNAGINIF